MNSKHQDKTLSDLVNLVLGLLINMAEKDKDTRSKLCSLSLGLFSDHDDAEIISIEKNFLDFLFVVANLGKSQDKVKRQAIETSTEVTVDMLTSSGGKKEKSICQTYASILLAFLVVDDGALKRKVARLFDECTLKPLIDAVKSFLEFLTFANALTEKQSGVLTDLISRLRHS